MLVAKRYRLGPSIGRGGMGEVFRAEDEQLGRLVAVKLLLPSGSDPGAAERFQREARAAARLSDPHVVSVYDFGRHHDGFFLVMELVEGPTVAAELARYGRLPRERAIEIVEQAAAGLAAAHLEDVVHRDVKPGNLLLAEDGTVKVADFGIAHVPGEGTTLTATGQIIGSTHYLAPERAGGGRAGQAADVYSLGCVLYELVTGRPPFTGEHPAAILYQHVDAAPAPPSLTWPELGGQFERVLLRMLAKDPVERPSAAEIAGGSLRGRLHGPEIGRVLAASAAGAADTERYADPIIAARSSAVPEAMPVGRRRKALVAAVIATLATAAGVLAGVVLNANDTRLPPATDVGPRPGGPSTPVTLPGATRTGPTDFGRSAEATPKTSHQPSRSASATPPTRSPGTASPGTTSTSRTTSPSQSSKPPSVPTRGTPPTSSSTSPTSTPATSSPPSSGAASPSPLTNGTTPASD